LKTKAMACFIYWIAPCFWRFSRWQSSYLCYTLKMSLPYSKSIWLIFLSSLPSSFFISWATFKVFMELQELSNIHYYLLPFIP
jgi:hypothetical protein